ncbi:MAG TPA: hypothetical protein VF603_13795 [Allosphingosinicella sp.]|jgi:hypothetical protein
MTITKPSPTPRTQNRTAEPAECCTSGNFSPLGIRLAVEADSAALLGAVAGACRGWEGDPEPGRLLRLDLRLRTGPFGEGPPLLSVEGGRLRIEGGKLEASADAETGQGRCAVHPDLLEVEQALRDEALDPLLLFLLTRSGRTPLHAAGFIVRDLAVLLLGPSGAGKSCLALAAAQKELTLLSDDTVYVQLQPELRVWGIPRAIHLFPGDAPEGTVGALRLRNGRLKQAVPAGLCERAPVAQNAALCLLAPGRNARLERIGPDEVRAAADALEPGFDLLRPDIEAALARLGASGGWRLTLSAEPAEAIDLLIRNLDRLEASAAR